MAKGYPERRADDDPFVGVQELLSEDVCRVCKKRAASTPHGLCETCDALLHPQSAAKNSA